VTHATQQARQTERRDDAHDRANGTKPPTRTEAGALPGDAAASRGGWPGGHPLEAYQLPAGAVTAEVRADGLLPRRMLAAVG